MSIKDEPKIYIGPDNRLRIVYFDQDKQKYCQMSYPKYIMEKHLNRKLLPNEDVHHIDGNTLNNDISNLEVKLKGPHQREHNLNNPNLRKYPKETNVNCFYCNKSFIINSRQQSSHIHQMKYGRSSRYFCSKSCVGKYGSDVQNKKILIKSPFEKVLNK